MSLNGWSNKHGDTYGMQACGIKDDRRGATSL